MKDRILYIVQLEYEIGDEPDGHGGISEPDWIAERENLQGFLDDAVGDVIPEAVVKSTGFLPTTYGSTIVPLAPWKE